MRFKYKKNFLHIYNVRSVHKIKFQNYHHYCFHQHHDDRRRHHHHYHYDDPHHHDHYEDDNHQHCHHHCRNPTFMQVLCDMSLKNTSNWCGIENDLYFEKNIIIVTKNMLHFEEEACWSIVFSAAGIRHFTQQFFH